jgi:hypothetical protein
MRIAALALAVLSLSAGRARAEVVLDEHQVVTSVGGGAGERQKISIDARGPVALIEVTRTIPVAGVARTGVTAELLLDLALPDGSALVALEVREGGKWRPIDEGTAQAPDIYRSESTARGVTPTSEPFDDGVTHRVRLVHGVEHTGEPFALRYRFVLLPAASGGRLALRFPAAPEKVPPRADVTVQLRDATDAEIAGVRTELAPGDRTAAGHITTRAAWQVTWTPRVPRRRDAAPLEARVAVARLGNDQTALALLARHPAGDKTAPPDSVLFLVDRSRSIGLPGLSAERDLVRALIEALPPSTRFDALFFDRGTKRLFPMSRPATREAIEKLETEMVPDRLQNGTDLPGALREAGALLRREATTFGPRALLVLVTDGAIGEGADAPTLERAFGAVPGLELSLAALTIRPVDDEPVGARARDLLRGLAASQGGVARELRASEIGEAVPALLADLQAGGDLGALRLYADGNERRLSAELPPGDALAGVIALKGHPPRAVRVEAQARGHAVTAALHVQRIPPEWLRPWIEPRSVTLFARTPSLLALVEPRLEPAEKKEELVKGSMDRMVVRNVLSLAYMPRARACYLNRTAATPALRDLSGKVRLAIDLSRGEVDRVTIESSTLGNPDIERCLTETAFEIEVPRATRSDAPVTAVLNMNFRPRTADRKADVDLGGIGDQIDMVIEEMRRREAEPAPALPR